MASQSFRAPHPVPKGTNQQQARAQLENWRALETWLNAYVTPTDDITIDLASDIVITSAGSGEILKYDGTNWINNTLAEAGISATGHSHVEADITDLQAYLLDITGESILDLSDVTGTISPGDVMVANGSSVFVPQALDVGDLSDVTLTGIGAGELLKWSGSAWINNTLAEAGISATGHTHVEADISDLGSYLPLSGGTLTGNTRIANTYSLMFEDLASADGWSLDTDVSGDLLLYGHLTSTRLRQRFDAAGNIEFWDNAGTSKTLEYDETAGQWIFTDTLVPNGDIETSNASQPAIRLDSTGTGDNWTAQGAMVAVGEGANADTNAVATRLTYVGNGLGYVGMGDVTGVGITTAGKPEKSSIEFYYNSERVRINRGATIAQEWSDNGDMHLNDDAGNDVLLWDDSADTWIFTPNGTNARVEIRDEGLWVDYSAVTLPHYYWVEPSNHTIVAASTYETAATYTFNVGTAHACSAIATVHATASKQDTTSANMIVRLDYSTDGGSTWTNGPTRRADQVNTNNIDRVPMSTSVGFVNTTPTGTVQFRIRCWSSSNTNASFDQMAFDVRIIGTF